MFCRVNKNKEIIEALKGYYPGYHDDLAKSLDKASEEQLNLYSVPVSEIAEVKDFFPGPLFLDSGTPCYLAENGVAVENPAALKELALKKTAVMYDEAVKPLLAKYPLNEIMTFSTKRFLAGRWMSLTAAEKEAALSDPEFSLIVHEAGAIATAAEVDALCKKITANAARFEVHCGMCMRVKKAAIKSIESFSGSKAGLDKIVSELVFPQAL